MVTWQHINLHGEYDFSDEKLRDTVGLEVSKILTSQPAKQREAKNKGNLFPYLPFPEML